MDIAQLSLRDMRQKLDLKELSVSELTDHYVTRTKQTNGALNSFYTITEEYAGERSEHAQSEIDNGNQDALTGIPYAAKDLFCTKGIRTTAGSKILDKYIPPYNATVINKLRDSVLIGKTNMDEFAMGSSTEHSAYGVCHNPYNLDMVPGGSSGGSAAAVAAGQVPFALGTDTGGSIRQPASFCNVVGFKPTYGRISRYGAIAMASSLDTVGTFTRTVEDAAVVLQELAGVDARDTTTPSIAVDDYLLNLESGVKGLRIGVPAEYRDQEGLDPELRGRYLEVVDRLAGYGAEIVEISLPHTKYALPAYYVLSPSEVSSNMSRYDGIQFGSRSEKATTLEEVFVKTREEGFGAEVKRRILVGTFCLSSGYVDAYYKKAQQVRTLITRDFNEAYNTVDLIVTPTSPTLPFAIGEREDDPLAMYAADLFTVPSSLAGLPAISVPTGGVTGLPVGIQLIAPQFAEALLFQAARAIEQSLDYPPLQLVV